MLARCARCHQTFSTDRFGVQRCPHCGAELLLADPNAPPPAAPDASAGPGAPPPGPPAPPTAPAAGPEAPAPGGHGAGDLPPPPGPPPGGYGGQPGGWAPPPPPPPGGWGPPPGPPGQPPGGWRPPPPGALPAGPELPAPFAERARLGFLSAFFETWKLVATQPQQFFRRVRADQSGSAVLFGVVAFTFGYAVQGLYSLVAGAQMLGMMETITGSMPEEQRELFARTLAGMSGWGAALQILAAPVLGFVLIYVAAAILHVVLLLLRATPRGFDATLTTVAYAEGLALLLAVPACGGLLYAVWNLVVLVVGLAEAQRCGTGKAAAAVFAPAILLCLCCCGAAAIGLGGLVNLGHGGAGGVNL
jgi:hypothetical protein